MDKRAILTLILAFLLCPVSVFSHETSRAKYVPGELLIKFRTEVGHRSAQSIHLAFGSLVKKRFTRIRVDYIQIPEGWSLEDALAMYHHSPDVEYVEPNYLRRALLMPNDPDFVSLWGLHNTGQSMGVSDADIDAPEAWDILTDCSSIIIATLDTGVDLDHDDLAENIWINTNESTGDANGDGFPGEQEVDDDGDGLIDEDSQGRQPGEPGYTNDLKDDDDENDYIDDIRGWDFINSDNDPDDDSAPDFHGTHVTGIMAGKGNNGLGITGVCWSASVMQLKTLDSIGDGSVADEIEAIEYAIDNGASIINASLGGPDYSNAEYEAIQHAEDAGVLFVAAAGNDGLDNDLIPNYPASYELNNIISVAATDNCDILASWSNYGATSVDVAAPGVSIYSTKAGNTYQELSGTSMAAPYVSALSALIWAEYGDLTYGQVKETILDSVDLKSNLEGILFSCGRINACASLSQWSPPLTLPNNGEGDHDDNVTICFITTARSDDLYHSIVRTLQRLKDSCNLFNRVRRKFPNLYSRVIILIAKTRGLTTP
jgi:subtilisin family serine protease